MRVFIITMDDPVQTNAFIKKVIAERKDWIVGVAISKGDRLKLGKGKSKVSYVLSLLLIMGVFNFIRNSAITLRYKVLKKLSGVSGFAKKKTLKGWLEDQNIPLQNIYSPNKVDFLDYLRQLNIDVIINQSQSILKKDILSIPRIGTINRHNALLPKNRGRLTPFWVLYRGEKETGVSIHFVTEKLDDGQIIVQKRFAVAPRESFNSLVKKNYEVAPLAMVETLDKLNAGDESYMPNEHKLATYNSTPSLKEAFRYRIMVVFRSK